MSYVTQKSNQPLYPEIIWNKPENKAHAGKLLIIGGNIHGITAPSTAYTLASKIGAGEVRVVLPDSCKKYFPHGNAPSDILFAKSTPSGSFGAESMSALLEYAAWADFVVVVGDISKNSETAIAISEIIQKIVTPLCITGDAIDAMLIESQKMVHRPNTVIIPTFTQLQKILIHAKSSIAITATMPFKAHIAALEQYGGEYEAALLYSLDNACYVAYKGDVSVTSPIKSDMNWELSAAITASVWAMQQPQSLIKALTTAVTQI
jgi:NAD(P)H-hydrate repair Nnr-like enzyme with NAD(P)H-hydrate dehydratase domain